MNHPEIRFWLIRYPNNSFSRPITERDLLQMFSSGVMNPKDEICPSKGYWFSLQDLREMRKHFGNIPFDGLFKKIKEEVTQERDAVTATITVSESVRSSFKQNQPPVDLFENSQPRTSNSMKVVLVILTLVVLTLLFVWFG